ncbi:hypothetical protein GLOIN_2v1485040 [Rhizophagus irregularis DAOM 181602=DAOM 197198]|nr:hypothetical protein GLOIN_2v1485040 [Rhizophagus irregularis DAOM 181602=DAOM 197198]
MKLKVKIPKEELRKVEEKLNDGIEIEFYDENNMRLKNWVITCEIITEKLFNEEKIELDEVIMKESDDSSENRSVNDDSEFNTEKDENDENNDNDNIVINENNENNEINDEIQKNETDNNEENEEIVKSENYQILMNRLKHKREDIDEEMLEKENEGLSLLQLYYKIRRNNLMKSRKRKTDKEEREKIYKEMIETGVKRTKKGLKRMMEKAEKVCLLVDKIEKKRVFESSCDITSVDNCTKKEIVEITEYFTSVQEMEE